MPSPPASLLHLAILLPLALAGCDGSGSFGPSPTAPRTSPPPPRLEWVVYVGNAAVVSAEAPLRGCGWWGSNTTVWWTIAVDGGTIQLDEEMEIVFTGTIQGREFVAEWQAPPEIRSSACPVLESTIAGTFSEDRRQLEALETTRWGPEAGAPTTERRWTLSRSGS